jgi:hypothetical protein
MGLSAEFCCLACTCGGADRGQMLSNSGEKLAAVNGLVSGDGHGSALANPISLLRMARGMSVMAITRWM